jgi:hypothetical protein
MIVVVVVDVEARRKVMKINHNESRDCNNHEHGS